MKTFTKISVVAVAMVFFLDITSANPVIEAGTNMASSMTNSAIDAAKNAMSKAPLVSSVPGANQMSEMANKAADMAKEMTNKFKDLASKASDFVPMPK